MKTSKKIMAVVLALLCVFTAPALTAQAASKGYSFSNAGAKVYIHGNAKSFIKKQGRPSSKKKSKSCAYKGEDIKYTYKNFILTTYTNKKGGTEYAQTIQFRNNKVKTDKGIKIGSTERQMLKKYGRKSDNFGVYTYKKGKMAIKFTVEDGKVTEIKYVAY